MSWLSRSLNSSIGKKFLMALTGICLIIFLKIHLLNNLLLFLGPEIFDTNVKNLEAVKPLVRVIEVILLTIFVVHIYNGIKLWFENKKANPVKYAVDATKENTSIFSRTMFVSGSIILIFLVAHISKMWTAFNFGEHIHGVEYHYYNIVADVFSNPFVSLFYVLCMVLLGFHLNHGFQSVFQTFGWTHKKYTPLINFIGSLYAIFTAVGFASVPIYFYILSLGGN